MQLSTLLWCLAWQSVCNTDARFGGMWSDAAHVPSDHHATIVAVVKYDRAAKLDSRRCCGGEDEGEGGR